MPFLLDRTALCWGSCKTSPPQRVPAQTLRASRGKRPSGNSSPAKVFTSWISWWFWKRWSSQQKCTQTHRPIQTDPVGRPHLFVKVSYGISVLHSAGLEQLCWENRPPEPVLSVWPSGVLCYALKPADEKLPGGCGLLAAFCEPQWAVSGGATQ